MATCGTQIMRGRPFIRSYFNKSHTEKKGKCKFATDWVHAWHVVLPRAVPPIILQLALITATDAGYKKYHADFGLIHARAQGTLPIWLRTDTNNWIQSTYYKLQNAGQIHAL